MTKHVAKGLSTMKKNLKIMGESLEKLDLNDTIKEIKFDNVKSLKKNEIGKITRLIRKYNGVIYGTSIAASINNPKAPVRKTTDLDIKFNTRSDQKNFSKEALKVLGEDKYEIKVGHFGESIKRKSDKSTIIDTSLIPRGYNHHKNNIYDVVLANEERYISMYTKHPKIVTYNKNIKGESYSTSSQRKIHAAITDASLSKTLKDRQLRSDKKRRTGKDFFDVRTYSADGYLKAMESYQKETDPQKKKELKKLINKYGRAILNFSAEKNVFNVRKETEKKYIKAGMLKQRHFTSNARNEMEKQLHNKLKNNIHLDLTKEGTKWIESKPIIKRKKTNKSKTKKVDVCSML